MPTTEKNVLNRIYLVVIALVLLAGAVAYQIFTIQFVDGDEYRAQAQERIFRHDTIPANRGNLYDANGQLLATSISRYDIRFDAKAPSQEDFNEYLGALCDSLSRKLNKPASYFSKRFRAARAQNNRYLLIAKGLKYSDYVAIKNFPLFRKGPYRGGIIVEQRVVREHPLGKMAERIVGYDVPHKAPVGLEGAFSHYLRGKQGVRFKQKIAKNQWKPISSNNEVEPVDGLDVYTTIDVNIQDVAHHALLAQLEKFEADHGTAVVMEVKTGEIKAISNLGRSSNGKYYEKRNYAVWETHEPGSTFKLMSVVAALEDKKVDTSTVYDTQDGRISYYGQNVIDSRRGGYGKISLARAFEVSSNTALVQMVYDNYKSDPAAYVDRLYRMGLNSKLNLPILGEGTPYIPHPEDDNWNGTSLPWMGFGYGVELTPLQTLTFYNAIANDGVMVKPRLIREVRAKGKLVEKHDREVLNPSVCSRETISKVKDMLENVVRRGTADNLYSDKFSMAGKTGTCKAEYWKSKGKYIASFAGYFPADDPEYSCIVVVHEPDISKGYYGNIVAGPVFKTIARKIYTSSPDIMEVRLANEPSENTMNNSQIVFEDGTSLPDFTGMDAMQTIALAENLGLKVKITGKGKVIRQSIPAGSPILPKTNLNVRLHESS